MKLEVILRVTAFKFAVAFLVACGGSVPEYYFGKPETFYPINIWVEDHKDIDPETVRQGCEMWSPEGLICELVSNREETNLEFQVDESPCVVEPGDKVPIIGSKIEIGITVLYPHCFPAEWQDDNTAILRVVSAHEIGHQIGIVLHVWRDCRTVEEHDSESYSICGPAIMNEHTDPELVQMTVPDHQAWTARSIYHSVIDEPIEHEL